MKKMFSNSPTPELEVWIKDDRARKMAEKYGLSLIEQNFIRPGSRKSDIYIYCSKTPGVTVVPVLPNENLIITRTFKQGANAIFWEFPAGRRPKNTSATDQVVAELSQESGLTAGKMIYLGSTYAAPRKFDTYEDLFVAIDCVTGAPKPDPGEILEVYEISQKEFWMLVFSYEERVSGFSEVAAWRAAALGHIKKP